MTKEVFGFYDALFVTSFMNVQLVCAASGPAVLSASVSDLELSVTGYTEYGVTGTPSSGLPRVITLTNTGVSPANNLSVTD